MSTRRGEFVGFLWFSAVSILVVAPGCSTTGAPPAETRRPQRVATTPAQGVSWARARSYPATVESERDAAVSSVTGGRLARVLVERGDGVKAGQVLAELGDGEARAAVAAAVAAVAQAQARLGEAKGPEGAPEVRAAEQTWRLAVDARERAEAVVGRGSVSEQDLLRLKGAEASARAQHDAALAGTKAALGQVRQAQAQAQQGAAALAQFTLRAPFDAVVLERFAAAGETVAAGAPVVRLIDATKLVLRFEVPPHEAGAVEPGWQVRVGEEEGRVVRVAPGLTGEGRSRWVEARLTGAMPGRLLPGAKESLWLMLPEQESGVAVPRRATRSVDGLTKAWVVRGGRIQTRLLEVVRPEGGALLVRRGVEAGELLVDEPPADLRDGEEVAP